MHSILTPMLALITLSLIVWVWMYATRIPAMRRLGVDPQEAGRFARSTNVQMPDQVRQVADNYNHLMEQPTIFYALVVYIYLAGHQDAFGVWMAWAYVALRVLHTIVQGTFNRVLVRFAVFSLGSLVLMVLCGRELWALV